LRGGRAKKLLGDALTLARAGWREPLKDSWRSYPAQWSELQKMQALDLEHALPDNLLVKADRMLMAHGLEGRMPFVDRRVVSWGLSLPDGQKRDAREGKKILKRWAANFMPTEHFAAKKRGFYVPVNDWWQGERLNMLSKVLRENAAIREWFRSEGVAELLEEQGRTRRVGRQLMTLLQFALWHRFFVETTTTELPETTDPLKLLAL
jgi:asparagine synthase (glutamine-hydrolysing)